MRKKWILTSLLAIIILPIIVIVAAVVTPTGDPYTLLLLSGPLYLLYEITIWLIRWTLRK